jgi:hypothetical protein
VRSWAGLLPPALALALTGCQTTAEKSAQLERAAKIHELQARAHGSPAVQGLSIARASSKVKVLASAVLHSAEGIAAVVTLRNLSSTPLREVPIQITVRDARGASLYTNTAPGLDPSLVSAPLLPAHGVVSWVDDQIRASGTPVGVTAKIGEAAPAPGRPPSLGVEGAHLVEDASNGPGVEGSIVNHSRVTQQQLVVYAVARRAGRVVAAGRAVLPQAPAGASTHFQLFLIGEPRGAQLEVSAPPSTVG